MYKRVNFRIIDITVSSYSLQGYIRGLSTLLIKDVSEKDYSLKDCKKEFKYETYEGKVLLSDTEIGREINSVKNNTYIVCYNAPFVYKYLYNQGLFVNDKKVIDIVKSSATAGIILPYYFENYLKQKLKKTADPTTMHFE